eukprot:TRINITY_DN442_c0_g1_i3.p1 TRINITY_DN442_c0_g1~~TRINITY_DN442_c0_g1_i3.p1  ORF type:complete len:148 (-),score=20.38 TRINITY_DN442_c0_g1_i3:434-877(-)
MCWSQSELLSLNNTFTATFSPLHFPLYTLPYCPFPNSSPIVISEALITGTRALRLGTVVVTVGVGVFGVAIVVITVGVLVFVVVSGLVCLVRDEGLWVWAICAASKVMTFAKLLEDWLLPRIFLAELLSFGFGLSSVADLVIFSGDR